MFFEDATEEIVTMIEQTLTAMAQETGLPYPYSRLSVVEIPFARGEIARVVPKALLVLVGAVVLFVDDDDAQGLVSPAPVRVLAHVLADVAAAAGRGGFSEEVMFVTCQKESSARQQDQLKLLPFPRLPG